MLYRKKRFDLIHNLNIRKEELILQKKMQVLMAPEKMI